MAVSLPTAADVRKAREQAARTAAERADIARTPLLAVLGAGDAAVTAVTKAAADVRERAAQARAQAGGVQQRLRTEDLRADIRKAIAELQAQWETAYAEFARRGEDTWGKIRQQPQVKQAIATLEGYTEQLDARVDSWVDEAHDAAEKALEVLSRQTRGTGERWAQTSQRFSGQAAQKVTQASRGASDAVAKTGVEVAGEINKAGAEVAAETRSATRKAASRTEPKTEPKPQPKTQPRPQPRPEAKIEPRPQAKVEPKPQARIEPKPAAKVEPKTEPRPAARKPAPGRTGTNDTTTGRSTS